MLLPLHIGPAGDQRETVKRRITEAVVLKNGFERTARSPMIQLHFGKPGCVKGDRSFSARGFEKLLFGHEEKFGLRVNEAKNEPRAGDAVHFNVGSSYPLHREPPQSTWQQVTFLSLSRPQSSVALSHEFQGAIRPCLERPRHLRPANPRKPRFAFRRL